jgi:4-diphosphocytidyl-2-C-methyl-D-erythritol kinase
VDIDVVKRIPMGAGLGGGSSDAATCLVALNQLWGTGVSTDELAAIGLKLGADVPVFVRGRVAWGEGVGERLTPLYPPLAPVEPNYLIIKPNVFVSTKDVFQDPELTRNTPPITIRAFLESGGGNDCLPVVRRRFPEVARAIEWLSAYGDARLTGTGACVFMACESARAREIAAKMPAGYEAFVAQGRNDSPLLQRLAA